LNFKRPPGNWGGSIGGSVNEAQKLRKAADKKADKNGRILKKECQTRNRDHKIQSGFPVRPGPSRGKAAVRVKVETGK